MAIVEVCGDPTTQLGCIDDTCPAAYTTNNRAFEITVAMVAGNTYSFYLGK